LFTFDEKLFWINDERHLPVELKRLVTVHLYSRHYESDKTWVWFPKLCIASRAREREGFYWCDKQMYRTFKCIINDFLLYISRLL